ncbi:nSTAND1 domain-containing NTPase [Streptomyces coeruleorubidus]|uniref:nSTAND1 domain-containing NTPase n=1 Tax=Streptomyces coeruleorubidus TaxID=116188 RepID=UPI0037A427EC
MTAPDESPAPEEPPAAEPAHFQARASERARIYQAGGNQNIIDGDVHLHYVAGVRTARRIESSTEPGKCPYPGLKAFGTEQARWFFGRDTLIADLLVRLDERLGECGPVAVVAPSGAGKSSLLRAGLLPALDRGALPGAGSYAMFTPTAAPLANLATQLADVTGLELTRIKKAISDGADFLVDLIRETHQEKYPAEPMRFVLVVDQLEELFTLCKDSEERSAFLDLLHTLCEQRAGGCDPVGLLVYGLRADFYGQCTDHPALRRTLQSNQLLVGPMPREGLEEAILYPAADVGLHVEPGLVDLLLRDLGSHPGGTALEDVDHPNAPGGYAAGRLPLLAHALRATWQQKHGNTLTVDAYKATGGIHHAIARTAEHRFGRLDKHGQLVARTIFLHLVKIGDGTEDTRRRVTRSDLLDISAHPEVADDVINLFMASRLLAQERDTVEIIHEALLYAWPRLREWIKSDRDTSLVRQKLEETSVDWERHGRETGLLYRGARLEAVVSWANSPQEGRLSPLAKAFLAASLRKKHRSVQRRRSVIVVLSVLSLLTTSAALVALHQRSSAQRERDAALQSRLVAEADALRDTDRSLAAQLDLVAQRRQPSDVMHTRLMSHANSPLSKLLRGHSGYVAAVAYNSKGDVLASAGADQQIRLWDTADPDHPKPLGKPMYGHKGYVATVAFNPKGDVLASAGADQQIRLWNTADPDHPKPLGQELRPRIGAITSLKFSADGRMLVSGGAMVRIWDMANPIRPKSLGLPLGGEVPVTGPIALSPDGDTLATSDHDNSVRLWDVTNQGKPKPLPKSLPGHGGLVRAVAFSPSGRTVATAGEDRSIRLWDISRRGDPKSLGGAPNAHSGAIYSIAFSKDGHKMASVGQDNAVRLWSVASMGSLIPLGEPLTGHVGTVFSVAFSPDGRGLASAGSDETVRLWSLPASILLGHGHRVSDVSFSPKGRLLATSGYDATVRLWNIADPAHPKTLGRSLIGHSGYVYTVAFSPDGRTLASGGRDRTVRLWDVSDPFNPKSLGKPLVGHTEFVSSVALSPDGRTLASGGGDEKVQLWNVANPLHPTLLSDRLFHIGPVYDVSFSRDGTILAYAGGRQLVRLQNISEPTRPKMETTPLIHKDIGDIYSVDFSSVGRLIVSASSDQSLRLWKLSHTSRPMAHGKPLNGHSGAVRATAFRSDGKALASAGNDRTVRLWDLKVLDVPKPFGTPLTGHTDDVRSIEYSHDGLLLASASSDTTVRLWTLDTRENMDRVCASTTPINEVQWARYLPGIPYDPPCSAQRTPPPHQAVTPSKQVSEIPVTPPPRSGTPSIPAKVVGTWCGGSNDAPEGHWTYMFGSDGTFSMENESMEGMSGHVTFGEEEMSLRVKGQEPIASNWSLSDDPVIGDILFIDGHSYVRGSCSD